MIQNQQKNKEAMPVGIKDGLCGARIELRCNGELILGTSVAKRPDNDAEYIALLEELLAVIKAPKHPAPEGF